ncbi:MAG: common central domain of tyrosinase family protein [Gemmatimonadetes bacterium]|nr:common central domain of tyrosinase family protein [Gemmatimonadota bacterium]
MATRRNVWELASDWADPILWYARGVAAMKAQGLAEPTSWRFYGAIHGIHPQLWALLGYLPQNEPQPSVALQTQFWQQCQHGSWYFLPWHRGYLLAFEAVVRAEVAKLGGPGDWALPYWNYFKAGQAALPPAFASKDWPDGTGNNPLFVPQRYGPQNDGNVVVPVALVNLNAMTDPDYTGVDNGGSAGFGGVDTGFAHSGDTHGGIETQPHDWVHGLVGGADPQSGLPGLMSNPDTAALDPIFWLHHANLDRLWEVWRRNPPTNVDPTEPRWLDGPASIGERDFTMPMPSGQTWTFTPGQMASLQALGYDYDDVSPAVPVPTPMARLLALGMRSAASAAFGGTVVKSGTNVEMIGASTGPVPIEGGEVTAALKLDQAGRKKVSRSLSAAAALTPATAKLQPDRVFLNLENVRGRSDATAFNVYVGVPSGADPAKHPELLAGGIALFGVSKASDAGNLHGGKGLNFVLEITDIVDRLHLQNALDVGALSLRIVPVRPVPKADQTSIGRISLFRQGH